MRIDLAAPPFSGHLHPILGIARILAPHHEVCVLTMPSAMPSVRAAGLNGAPLLDGWETRLKDIIDTPNAVRSNPVRMFRQLTRALDVQRQVKFELETRYQNDVPDLLIADFTLVAAGHLAESRGISWWTSLPSPCVLEGGDGPPAYLGGLAPMASAFGRIRDQMGSASIRGFKLAVGALFGQRLRDIGVESIYRADGSESAYSHTKILAFGSPAIEFRRQWPDFVRLMPLPLYTPPSNTAPPPFIPGRRHVLATLGTHLKFAKEQMAQTIRELAVQFPDCEFHFSDGDLEPRAVERAGNFTRLPFVDYQRHLNRYALVVHHGGAGIMYHTLAAGLPAIVCPVDYDQFDHAARLQNAGLAWWIDHRSNLGSAVGHALNDAGLARRCADFAQSYQSDCTTDVIEEVRKLRE